jgi:predicted neuraminidase
MYLLQRIPWLLFWIVYTTTLVSGQSSEKAILQTQLIFPVQEKHTHGSSLVHLPNGDFLATWFYGSGERNADDVKIMGARLKKGDKVWSEPFLMADTPGIPDCNPVLFLNYSWSGLLFMPIDGSRRY